MMKIALALFLILVQSGLVQAVEVSGRVEVGNTNVARKAQGLNGPCAFALLSIYSHNQTDEGATQGGRSKAAAFTLVEALVVVAVGSILFALLLPSLSKAKMQAKMIECMNNQRQLTLAWQMYTFDNNDTLVANGQRPVISTVDPTWVQGAFVRTNETFNESYLLDPRYALFANYIKSAKTYMCPTDRKTMSFEGQIRTRVRSYALNGYLGWDGHWDARLSENFLVFRKSADLSLAGPSDIFSFQDVQPDSICWPYFGVYMERLDGFFNFPNSSHNDGGVVSFSDGHIIHHRWQDKRTIRAESNDYHAHKDLSHGNPDARWLREHCTIHE